MSGSESPPGAGASAPLSSRAFIHECNNLLAGILNATALLKRARTDKDRAEAVALIEDAVSRAQTHLQRLPRLVTSEESASAQPAKFEGKRRRVLVTEDDDLNRQLLKKLLESTGRFDVTEAPNGSKAIESYRSDRADLVILDLGLPDLGGAEVLERITRIDTKAKILLLSGYLDARDPLTRAPQVVGFLQKPVEPPVLIAAIDRALAL